MGFNPRRILSKILSEVTIEEYKPALMPSVCIALLPFEWRTPLTYLTRV